MATFYLLGLGWANGWVLFESAHHLPAGYELGKLFQNPQLTHNVPTGYIAVRPQWMQTVMWTYANASMEAVNVRCMPRGEFCQLIQETVQENTMSQVLALLQEMQSSMEAAAARTELLLNMELVQVQRVQAAFIPIVVEGDLTPESDEGRHLVELSEEMEEGDDREETSL